VVWKQHAPEIRVPGSKDVHSQMRRLYLIAIAPQEYLQKLCSLSMAMQALMTVRRREPIALVVLV